MARDLRSTVNEALAAASRWRLFIALLVVYVYVFPYFASLRHANELPRVLTTMQLVDHATFRLDSRVGELGSRVDISVTPDGHSYQNKAPGLALLGVPVYAPVALVCRILGRPPSMALVTWLLRVSIVTVPAILFLACFREVSRRFASSTEARNGALVAYALGSMALPYGMLFMSHTLAASLLGAAFALSVRAARGDAEMTQPRALGVGALLGLSMLVEYQAIFGAVLVGIYTLSRTERRLRAAVAMAAAATPFVAILAAYHASAFGSPFRTGYAYSADVTNRIGFMGVVGFSKQSALQAFLLPSNGLLLLSPWVLLSVVGAVAIAMRPEARARVGAEAATAAAIAVAYCAFVAALAPHFGRAGWAVGPRYIAIAMPFFAWLAAAGLELCLEREATTVPAYALILVGVGVHVIAATTFPHWPVNYENPLFEVSLRLLREGHTPRSIGRWLGLPGALSVAPLYLGVALLVARLLAPKRERLLELALGAALAAFVIARYERLAATDQSFVDRTWSFMTYTVDE